MMRAKSVILATTLLPAIASFGVSTSAAPPQFQIAQGQSTLPANQGHQGNQGQGDNSGGGSTGEFCLLLKSAPPPEGLGVDHHVFLNYTDVKNGLSDVYGKSCYTLHSALFNQDFTDCAPVSGSAIIQNGRIPGTGSINPPVLPEFTPMLEIALSATEHHDILENVTSTTSGTHIWIKDLQNLTGTWAAQSKTSVEGINFSVDAHVRIPAANPPVDTTQELPFALLQLDGGTAAGVPCPPETDQDRQAEKLLKDTLKSLDHL